jgi:hypothetical protein
MGADLLENKILPVYIYSMKIVIQILTSVIPPYYTGFITFKKLERVITLIDLFASIRKKENMTPEESALYIDPAIWSAGIGDILVAIMCGSSILEEEEERNWL